MTPRQKGTVEATVPCRSAELCYCRTKSVLGKIVPHPSHLARPLIRVHLTKVQRHHTEIQRKGNKPTLSVHPTTSYFGQVWNAFSQDTDGSMQWILKQIVSIGEDFHSQVGDDKVRT
jgi:hypothetical protein